MLVNLKVARMIIVFLDFLSNLIPLIKLLTSTCYSDVHDSLVHVTVMYMHTCACTVHTYACSLVRMCTVNAHL